MACGSFSCSMWNAVPQPGIKPRLPASGAQSLSHWTTREVPTLLYFLIKIFPTCINMASQRTPASSPLLSGQIPGGVLYGIPISKTLFGITKKKKIIQSDPREISHVYPVKGSRLASPISKTFQSLGQGGRPYRKVVAAVGFFQLD